MEVTKVDLMRADTILRVIRRGQFDLEGEEVLAFAQAYHWQAELVGRIKKELETPPPAPTPIEQPKPEIADKPKLRKRAQ